nr:unnamed protein product [Callosobruchus chinensis]
MFVFKNFTIQTCSVYCESNNQLHQVKRAKTSIISVIS